VTPADAKMVEVVVAQAGKGVTDEKGGRYVVFTSTFARAKSLALEALGEAHDQGYPARLANTLLVLGLQTKVELEFVHIHGIPAGRRRNATFPPFMCSELRDMGQSARRVVKRAAKLYGFSDAACVLVKDERDTALWDEFVEGLR
jgi:hypothetical protein